MIYLDNAATTFPKPPQVCAAVYRFLCEEGGNPGRGSHMLALRAAERVYDCREALSAMFEAHSPERVIFTLNTTHALNLALKGLVHSGEHVLISELEHNAVRRPLFRLQKERGVSFDCFPVLRLSKEEILQGIDQRLQKNTTAIACSHASNICSVSLPLSEIGALCRQRGIKLIVDAAQSAGILPISMKKMQIDALALPSHKALYGPQGCGALLLGERCLPEPLLEGGSGVASLAEQMPEEPPERYEAGTLPTPAIAGLLEGIRFLRQIGIEHAAAHERELFVAARERLLSRADIFVHAPEISGSVLLFHKRGTSSTEVAHQLTRRGICVRAGLHCAPLAHTALQTPPDGAVRISFGYFNTINDVDALWHALG